MGFKLTIENMKTGLKIFPLIVLWLIFIIALLSTITFYPWLPSDETMIKHFYEHRTDIEELVSRYRSFVPENNDSHSSWSKQMNTLEIMKRSGVHFISSSSQSLWLPNPYSQDSGKKVDAMIHGGGRKLFNFQKYEELQIRLIPQERYSASNLYYGVIWKWIVSFPENPRIEHGKLIFPTDSADDEPFFEERVENSLNMLPFKWMIYGCAYRKIEDYWFLKICNGH